MKTDSIAVDLRLSTKADSKVKAFADVTVTLDNDGTITVMGFSVLETEGRPTKIMAPARKGKQAYFDTVQLTGRIRGLVEQAVLVEYEHQKSSK